jgi:hypothetical protein
VSAIEFTVRNVFAFCGPSPQETSGPMVIDVQEATDQKQNVVRPALFCSSN